MNIKLELLELLNQREEVIAKQGEIIAKLINENVEQESIISELMLSVTGCDKCPVFILPREVKRCGSIRFDKNSVCQNER